MVEVTQDSLLTVAREVEAEMEETYREWIESGCDPSEAITLLYGWGARLAQAIREQSDGA